MPAERRRPVRIGVKSSLAPAACSIVTMVGSVCSRAAVAVRWLIAHGVDVNAKRHLWDCKQTALHMTAENGSIEIVRMLLDAGADPNIHDDKYDATVLAWRNSATSRRLPSSCASAAMVPKARSEPGGKCGRVRREEFQASETGRQSLRKRTDCRSLRVLQPWANERRSGNLLRGSGKGNCARVEAPEVINARGAVPSQSPPTHRV
jgi:Ankyrin repeats (3 copies)